MKKLATLLIAICLFLSAASCSSPPTSPGQTITSTPGFSATPTPSASPTSVPTGGQLEIHFIDVGQGDSILIDLGETEVLIGGGEKSPGLVDYLKEYVDGPLEVMVATHSHSDHIGGLIAVLGAFQVQQIWDNGDKSDSSTYNEFMAAVQAESADVHVGKRGDQIVVGRLTFLILNPKTSAGIVNNNSLVLSLSYGSVDFLFTGDAEKEAEGAMLVASDIPVPDVEILKVGHHGSRTASSPAFLASTSPEVAIYSAGADNSYGHPHQETLAALARIGAKVYGTDVNGTVIITTDGETRAVAAEK
jgi:beta-lactamase superfamily II metal-dependent hydrolase